MTWRGRSRLVVGKLITESKVVDSDRMGTRNCLIRARRSHNYWTVAEAAITSMELPGCHSGRTTAIHQLNRPQP